MAEKKEARPKKARKQQHKVRVKLPGIESYEKELEFTAEGPGRVVVRLERLMGSDRIRITDPKYLATLVERLELEEKESWASRSRLRKKAEKNRSRQLAIEGLMEPSEDMQDLWNHPVFRVNRVLNRLAAFDLNMSHAAGTLQKQTPINPIEPFTAEDGSGGIFKGFPGHHVFVKEKLPYDDVDWTDPASRKSSRLSHRLSRTSMHHGSHDQDHTHAHDSIGSQNRKSVKPKIIITADDDGDEEEEEEEEEEVDKEEETLKKVEDHNDGEVITLQPLRTSIQELQLRYGIKPEEELERDWQAFRSHLVEMVYEDGGGHLADLYGLADDVIGVYSRQQETTEDHMSARTRQVQELEKIMSSTKPVSSSQSLIAKPKKAEEEEEEEEEE